MGRGPLAGPVAVCAFAMPYGYDQKVFVGVKDSKKLSKIAREKWAKIAGEMKKNKKCFHSVCFTGHKIIDQKGIVKAIKMALGRALKKVLVEISCGPEECEVLLDGSLKAPKIFSFQETIIKGDSKVQIISLASVVAKVKRDKKMTILAKKYPNYGFEIHKGYGTSYHYKQIKKLGLSEIHRRSYLKNLQKTIV